MTDDEEIAAVTSLIGVCGQRFYFTVLRDSVFDVLFENGAAIEAGILVNRLMLKQQRSYHTYISA